MRAARGEQTLMASYRAAPGGPTGASSTQGITLAALLAVGTGLAWQHRRIGATSRRGRV
jgi:hypothetical protein